MSFGSRVLLLNLVVLRCFVSLAGVPLLMAEGSRRSSCALLADGEAKCWCRSDAPHDVRSGVLKGLLWLAVNCRSTAASKRPTWAARWQHFPLVSFRLHCVRLSRDCDLKTSAISEPIKRKREQNEPRTRDERMSRDGEGGDAI